MLTVNCPRCGQPVEWTPAQRWRPFCSERCKLMDLGAWASEAYRIPAQELDDSLDENVDTEAPPDDPGH